MILRTITSDLIPPIGRDILELGDTVEQQNGDELRSGLLEQSWLYKSSELGKPEGFSGQHVDCAFSHHKRGRDVITYISEQRCK